MNDSFKDPMVPVKEGARWTDKFHTKMKNLLGGSTKSAFNIAVGLVAGIAAYLISDSAFASSFAIAAGTEASNRFKLYERIFKPIESDSGPDADSAVA